MPVFFKSNLKYCRVKKGITQDGLASQVKKARTTINNWESGVSEPSITELEILCNILDVSGHDLLFRDMRSVQGTSSSKPSKSEENVQGNVQENVQGRGGNAENLPQSMARNELQKDDESYLHDLKDTNKTLSIAIKGLEAANSMLLREVDDLKEEIRHLKGGSKSLGTGMDSPEARTAG